MLLKNIIIKFFFLITSFNIKIYDEFIKKNVKERQNWNKEGPKCKTKRI
jgi:hypothetical protein